ncbi:MAG TPA: M56 family metallopeptidase [Mucilaginibacter sp.]|jgi:hypothetical protein
MPVLFVFLLKVNIALLLFCAGYYLVLRHLTFYTLNRAYLVTAILFATIYPEINISGFVQRHQQLTEPVQAIALNWQSPAERLVRPFSLPNYWLGVEILFWAGVVLLGLRLFVQLYSLYKLYKDSEPRKIFDHQVRVVKGKTGPFSFWKSIYVNPDNHEPADLKAILSHEQVHINEWHTIDVLLAELSTIFYWFNPGIWLMKKAIRENIEFITDNKILKSGADSKQYQYSLVSVSFAASSNTIVNHFNISTIKKRIIMMNTKRSSGINLTRYAFLVPAVVVLLLVFSISKAALIRKSYDIMVNKAVAPAKNHIKSVKKITLSVKPVKSRVVDTIKKGNIFISTSKHPDTLNYVINGVKATKADFNALDSSLIYSIEILPADQAKTVYDGLDNKHSVLFVTTDDSESGKRFKEKIDKSYTANGSGNNRTAVSTGNGVITTNASSGSGISISGVSTNAAVARVEITGVQIAPQAYKITTMPRVGGKVKVDTIIVNGKPVAYKRFEPYVVMSYSPDSLYRVSGNLKKPMTYSIGKGNTIYVRGNNPPPAKVYTISPSDFDADGNIEHLSAKMIMIDGKEATKSDLKKLSAADIESMNVKSGEEVIKKYGDKAKNGVVFITTTKAKK